MRIIKSQKITEAVARLCIRANCRLSQDVKDCIQACHAGETWPIAKDTLGKIIENYELAARANVPVCQDTGVACVFLEIGEDVHISGRIADAVDEGVRRGYGEGYLRKSVVSEPLFERINTKDNTPAFLYTEYVPGDQVTVTVAPKGFGSENESKLKMLLPSDGIDGVIKFVVESVAGSGPNPCPPVLVGVGLGGTFDKAALLAKKALLRPAGQPNADPRYAQLETELLEKINALGIGPQGYGGRATALAVAIEYTATHIAGLPCAINLNCHVARHASEVI
ncbi:MAG: fumarate hydratase [Oscillospiraceae bacterium]|nr:fumarate hydratase [Oscillospiraceae bacterium]